MENNGKSGRRVDNLESKKGFLPIKNRRDRLTQRCEFDSCAMSRQNYICIGCFVFGFGYTPNTHVL